MCFLITDESVAIVNWLLSCLRLKTSFTFASAEITVSYILNYRNYLQSNLNSSNIDGAFTMANSNSFLSPTKFFR